MVNVYVSTNGCIEAKLSTKQLKDYLLKNNYNITKNIKDADYIIFSAKILLEIVTNSKQTPVVKVFNC